MTGHRAGDEYSLCLDRDREPGGPIFAVFRLTDPSLMCLAQGYGAGAGNWTAKMQKAYFDQTGQFPPGGARRWARIVDVASKAQVPALLALAEIGERLIRGYPPSTELDRAVVWLRRELRDLV